MVPINRKHKDRLFRFLFGNHEHRDWTLSLYNAVNGSDYQNPDDIQITTIDDVIYMGMKNDVSFLISDMLNIYEQQSTFNPNMPVRLLMYVGKLYDKYISINHKNIYSHTLVHLPAPRLVVFYNGLEDREDTVLRLSDAFQTEGNPKGSVSTEYDIEVKARMLNINHGHNKDIMKKCRPLAEYAWFIDTIRQNSAEMSIEDAVDHAIDDMPKDNLIRPYLLANRTEVKNMCITEYDEAETMEMFKEEGRKQGRIEGHKEGRIEGHKEGEDKLGKLMATLFAQGLTEDAKKAAIDKQARDALYRKYGID